LKRASIRLQKHKVPSQEANPQPLAWQTWNLSVRLLDQCVEWQSDRFLGTASC